MITASTPTRAGSNSIATVKNSLNWFGTMRGRLGHTFDHALIYATGGLAFGGVQDKLSVTARSGGQSATKRMRLRQ